MMLAHVADEEGVVAARNAVAEFKAATASDRPVASRDRPTTTASPRASTRSPRSRVVGSTRDGAKERGLDAVQAVAKFAANGKALGEGEADGFVQIVAEKGTGRIVGCQIVGPHAVETIHEVALAMKHGITVRELAETVHAHPTVTEVIKMAASDAADKCG